MNTYKNAIASQTFGLVTVILFPDSKTILKSNLSGRKLIAWKNEYSKQVEEFINRPLKGLDQDIKIDNSNPIFVQLSKEISTINKVDNCFGFRTLINAYKEDLTQQEERYLKRILKDRKKVLLGVE